MSEKTPLTTDDETTGPAGAHADGDALGATPAPAGTDGSAGAGSPAGDASLVDTAETAMPASPIGDESPETRDREGDAG